MGRALTVLALMAWLGGGACGPRAGTPAPAVQGEPSQEPAALSQAERSDPPPPPSSTGCVATITPQPVSPAPADARWPIRPGGVGAFDAGGPLPALAWELEGTTREGLVQAPLRGKDELQAMTEGLKNQDGYRTLRLTAVDLVIVLTRDERVRGLWPGPSLRTPEGTGIGSTLAQLLGAHGDATLTRFPEPHECGVTVPGYPGVTFLFRTCEDACGGGAVQAVYLHGDDDPEEPGE